MIEVKHLQIGQGKPKITVPVTASTAKAIVDEAFLASESPADIVEWRADYFESWRDDEAVLTVLSKIKRVIDNKILMFTFRTADEGGEFNVKDNEYIHLLQLVITSGLIEMVDVECCVSEFRANEIIPLAKEYGIVVVGSNHSKVKLTDQELEFRIKYMQRLGADTVKITTYPDRKKEVMRLLNMTYSLSEELDLPITIVGKGPYGLYTKACAEFFGSALVCGVMDNSDHPDELGVYALADLLNQLHDIVS